jgi:hypothetical protein
MKKLKTEIKMIKTINKCSREKITLRTPAVSLPVYRLKNNNLIKNTRFHRNQSALLTFLPLISFQKVIIIIIDTQIVKYYNCQQ